MKNIKAIMVTLTAGILIGGFSLSYATQTSIPSKTMEAAQTAMEATQNKPVQKSVTPQSNVNYLEVAPLDLVASPERYYNRHIKVKAKFDKFSTLGLDYAPAMRSSEKFISFLIQRPDVADHDVPLSEMKIFMNRTEAEKHIDMNSGDIIEFTGKVFSTALGDVWVDVEKFTVISTAPKTQNKK
ncbi:MAG: hypothetical protein LKG27_05295 [Clostridiaceae bacterium]|jgi:lysyl-tRNA synthetase class II|nr:hypothetical protein [Clostridiaceae bacterium]